MMPVFQSPFSFPPAFADVPTDAEYAMELISQRVAAGLDVRPARLPKAKRRDQKEQDREGDVETVQSAAKQPEKDIDWKKWGERAVVGMNWAEDGKRIFTAGQVCAVIPQLRFQLNILT